MNSSDEAPAEALVVEILRRSDVQRHIPWPDDERDAYEAGGGWSEGTRAVELLRARKIIAAVRSDAAGEEARRVHKALALCDSGLSRRTVASSQLAGLIRAALTAAGSVPRATPVEEWRTTTGTPLGREPQSRRPIARHRCGCITGWDDVHEECVLRRCSAHGPVATPTEPHGLD